MTTYTPIRVIFGIGSLQHWECSDRRRAVWQWSLESQGEGIIALSVYSDARINWTTRVLLQSRQQVRRGLVAPSPGTFKNQQATIPAAIQESGDGYGSFDLPQRWENEGEYIFLEMPEEQGQLASYLKDREVEMH